MSLWKPLLRRIGLFPAGPPPFHDLDPDFWPLYERSRHHTMTSVERMYSLYHAVRYVSLSRIPGDVVECGVWKGGSAMLAALALLAIGDRDRKLYLYDTYEGMAEPSERDVSADGRKNAREIWRQRQAEGRREWCCAPIEDVKANLLGTGYGAERLCFVKGRVEETIPATAPQAIALLRLDTDWYESTWHELVHLFPRLSVGGVLLIDDYGAWKGAKEATDRYFAERGIRILLHRIDNTGRIAIKLEG